ncbi:MAG: type II toxin-antitoxin system RelE/ParE family toxin [bacterium]
MRLELSKALDRFLARIPKKHAGQITRKIDELLINPYPIDSKLLSGIPLYRVDVGEYRIAYRAYTTMLVVVLVGKRNDGDVYRRLARMFR